MGDVLTALLDGGRARSQLASDLTFRPKVYDYGDEGTDTITVIGEVVWCVYPFDYEF